MVHLALTYVKVEPYSFPTNHVNSAAPASRAVIIEQLLYS